MNKIILNDGNSMPYIGYGPGIFSVNLSSISYCPAIIRKVINKLIYNPLYRIKYASIIASALEKPAYYLDYSFTYGNIDVIKKAIKKVGREKLFISSRVSNHSQINHSVKTDILNGLKSLELEYLDLLEFHWPVTNCYEQTWLEMEQLQKDGYVKSIGVANCNIHHLEKIIQIGSVIPAVNQIEMHPLFTQKELLSYCRSRGILIQAYTSIARFDDRMVRLPLLKEIGKKHKKSIVQIILRWHLQNGVSPVIKSWNKQRIQDNLNIFDFELSKEEIEAIDGININSRLRYDPDNCDFSIL